MDVLNSLFDALYFGLVEPLFILLGRILYFFFIGPFATLQAPVWVIVVFLSVITAFFSFWMRRKLRVDEKVAIFNRAFAAKREKQQDLQLITDRYQRSTLYDATDDELNDDFNTYIAHHYARYVIIYLLPIFLVLAWLNTVFSESYLLERVGIPYVLPVPVNSHGVEGLSVTFIFLLSYIVSLLIGFQFMRRKKVGEAA